ncbi:hypothetical protein Pan181_02320 [Aeoliella mucimassa]|uniref:Uncharacterized protein n=2 Tax=Aeoliella mucimassa TaxID=2527972 RepID=A0A518AH66_9BACT|nr:hypothetical protein Pan181_02320 [Aeoliella mucimassa]
MWKYLLPRIALADLPAMLLTVVVGSVIAGLYGVVHDQLTYSIGPEYFTQLKFKQFHYADFGLADRVFVVIIGFLATWWVGAIAGWLLARRLIPHQPRARAIRQIGLGIVLMLTSAAVFGLAAYGYGLLRGPTADYSAWSWVVRAYQVTDLWAFVRVAYIHNSGYLGGLLGLVVALLLIRPAREEP